MTDSPFRDKCKRLRTDGPTPCLCCPGECVGEPPIPPANEEEIDYVIASLVAKGLAVIGRDEQGRETIALTDKGQGVATALGINPLPNLGTDVPDLG